MNPLVRSLFHKLAGLPPGDCDRFFAEHEIAPDVRAELESLLRFDSTGGEDDERLLHEMRSLVESMAAEGDPSLAGQELAHYKIVEKIGSGGMGEVYLAHDAKLGRDVAIKVLPEHFARDAGRVARFRREAQVLASLNHSNIAAIYDLQKVAGTQFLILELVEGETLAERIGAGALPVDEAVAIATQIAEALEAAHDKGIVHRDLKPANIKITPEGKVKVLDFGLAKMFESEPASADPAQSPTFMTAGIEGGVILGTVSYMSPEHARGRAVTKQTDIWAFGCVLFEMLTGRKAFSAETAPDTIAKILKEEPEWADLNTVAPPAIRRIVERCLQKDPRRRLRDAGDIRLELEESLVVAPPAAESPTKRWAVILGVLLSISILMLVSLWLRFPTGDSPPAWSGTSLGGPVNAMCPRVSPDGKMLAFQALVDGQTQVAVMNPQSGNWTVLTHDRNSGYVDNTSWSKDGTKIYFGRHRSSPLGIYSIPALGGEPRLLLENAGFPEVLPDGSLVIVRVNSERTGQLYRFWPDTGQLAALNALLANAVFPQTFRIFPGSGELVFFGKPSDASYADSLPRLYMLDVNKKDPRPIGPEGNVFFFPPTVGVNPLDRSVLVPIFNGDLQQIVSIPSDGKTPARVLMTLTQQIFAIDMALDGSLYVDQAERPLQVVRFNESVRTPETVDISNRPAPAFPILELPDNRFLVTGIFDGRRSLLITRLTGELAPFIDTTEETRGPAFAGSGRIAFSVGKPPQQSIGIASLRDGRLIERLRINSTSFIRSLSASPDGTTLFYSEGGSIWSIPASGGDARRLGMGDALAFDRRNGSLIVLLNEQDGSRLVRMPASGGPTEVIRIHGDPEMEPVEFGPDAVRADGKIVLSVVSNASWFQGVAVLDPDTGNLRRIPLRYDGDLYFPSWNQKNEIIASGNLLRSSLWRFRAESKN